MAKDDKPDTEAEKRDAVLRRMLATPKVGLPGERARPGHGVRTPNAPAKAARGGLYAQIQAYVLGQYGFSLKTCWIAHVLDDHGLTRRTAPNRIDKAARAHPCPPGKRPAIEAALRHLGKL